MKVLKVLSLPDEIRDWPGGTAAELANAYSADCDRRFRPDVTGDSGRVDAV